MYLIELLFVFLGVWWLAVMPGAFLLASFNAISAWFEAKAIEIRRRKAVICAIA